MCLIIASEAGKWPEQELIEKGFQDNPHSWGLMVADGRKVRVSKGFTRATLLPAVESARRSALPYVLHYRWATHGKVDLSNCHPFRVRRDLWMAHNGVLSIPTPQARYSDTWHFVEALKANRLSPADIARDSVRSEIGREIGSSKLAFLDSTGRVALVNEHLGSWHTPDIWLSNTNSVPMPDNWLMSWRRRTSGASSASDQLGDTFGACDWCEGYRELKEIEGEFLCSDCMRYFGDEALCDECQLVPANSWGLCTACFDRLPAC